MALLFLTIFRFEDLHFLQSQMRLHVGLGPNLGGSDLTKGSADMYNVPTLTTDFGFWQTCLV